MKKIYMNWIIKYYNKIKLNIKYNIFDSKEKKNEEIYENFEIESEEIQTGEEIFKLIINEYILKNNNLNEEKKQN